MRNAFGSPLRLQKFLLFELIRVDFPIGGINIRRLLGLGVVNFVDALVSRALDELVLRVADLERVFRNDSW